MSIAMRKLNTTVFLLLLLIATMEAFGAIDQTSNQCPKSKPWPCRTPNVCLSFALICDGEIDCPDEYDEDPDMCTAKDRPAEEHLQGFINKYRRWLIPNILGEGTPVELATKLVESRTIVDYAKDVHLTEEQAKKLVQFFDGIKSGKQIVLLLLGMPLGAWTELYELFSRIYRSGFMDTVDELPGVRATEKRFLWNRDPYYRMGKWRD
ncbi:Prohormone-4 [Fasciola hepatica]|uniref:Prohormone-4 n=1 Tax=Fasciola hepatica TaxID=6192 RepID=A0A4E0RVI6_FASHE|nr:Prohormone-4 [Fasciola hepatica]